MIARFVLKDGKPEIHIFAENDMEGYVMKKLAEERTSGLVSCIIGHTDPKDLEKDKPSEAGQQ